MANGMTYSLLIISSLASFFPQVRRLQARHDGSGISLPYTLFNLVVAAEQLTVSLHLVAVDYKHTAEGLVHHPPTAGDWLNVAQFGAVWFSHSILYVVFPCICHETPRDADTRTLQILLPASATTITT